MSFISLFVFSFLFVHLSIGLYFPQNTPVNWDPIDDQNLICPTLFEEKRDLSKFEGPFSVLKPTLKHQVSIEGFLCHKITWITTCAKGFFGSESITNTISSEYIMHTECEAAVDLHLTAGKLSKGFPPSRCSWMSTSSETNSEIVVTPRSVIIDPITGGYIDSIFVGGVCNKSPCDTIHQELLWLTRRNKTNICMDQDHHAIQIHVKLNTVNSSITDFDIWSEDLIATSTIGACISSYCGTGGIKLHSGEWIAFETDSESTRVVTLHMPYCEDQVGEKVLSNLGLIDLATRNIYYKLRQAQCQKAKSDILASTSISRSDLQLFTPTRPGRHPVYRFNAGSVEVSTADYIYVNIDNFINRSTMSIGKSKANKSITWDSWIQTTSRIRDGPNGLYLYDFRIIHPDLTYDDEINHIDKSLKLQLNKISHPALTLIKDHVFTLIYLGLGGLISLTDCISYVQSLQSY